MRHIKSNMVPMHVWSMFKVYSVSEITINNSIYEIKLMNVVYTIFFIFGLLLFSKSWVRYVLNPIHEIMEYFNII